MQPMGMVLNTILDIVELQKGKLMLSDTPHGKIHFLVKMYAFKWELRFQVTDLGYNRCCVEIGVEGDRQNRSRCLSREFALLDSMLIANTEIEFCEAERRDGV